MLKNYIATALRIFSRNKAFSLINILGLALSMSVCLFIIVLMVDQNSYDTFHANKDRIYRVVSDRFGLDPSTFATSPPPLGEILRVDVPGVEQVVQVYNNFNGEIGPEGARLAMEGLGVSGNFFEVFDFNILAGDLATMLQQPRSVILTRESAGLLFGDGDPMGEVVSIADYGDFTVTAVAENPPANSHIGFDFLVPHAIIPALEEQGLLYPSYTEWADTGRTLNYVLMAPGADPDAIQPLLDRQSEINYPNPEEYALGFQVQPLTDIYLAEFRENDVKIPIPAFVVYFLSCLALLVILSAAFNYTGLSLARALKRAREIGIRKVAGATRGQLVSQFIGEALLLSGAAFLVAIVILEAVLLPGFSGLWLANVFQLEINTSLTAYVACLAFCLLTGCLAGLVPSYYLSSFKPEEVMKGVGITKQSKLGLRKALIIVQFALSLVFITTVFTVYQQMNYMLDADYGFNEEGIINVDLQGQDYRLVRNEFSTHPGISAISASSLLPNTGGNRATLARRSVEDEVVRTYLIDGDANYIPTLEMTLVAGRNFPQALSGETERYIIINESAVTAFNLGSPENAIGQTLNVDAFGETGGVGNGTPVEILGVIGDFHYRELMAPIAPFMLRYRPATFEYLNIRLNENRDPAETLAFLESTWHRIDPAHPLQYGFFERQIADSYSMFLDISKVLGFVCVLSISIAVLGLLGISALSAEEKIRELGIRKVVGASDWNLLSLLTRNYVVLLGLAMVVALPLAWGLNSFVLENFPYRIDSPLAGTVLGVVLLLALGFMTVGSQAFRATRSHPTEALRYE